VVEDGSLSLEHIDEFQEAEFDIIEIENVWETIKILNFISEEKLIDIDKIMIDYDVFLEKSMEKLDTNREIAEAILNQILSIEIPMLDDGKRTDYYFIHF